MKLLMVIPAIGPVYGGTSKIVIELAQALGKLGVLVDLVTTDANGSIRLDVPFNTWCDNNNYRTQYFPGWLPSGEYKVSWSFTRWLFQHVADYDLVHLNALFCYPSVPTYLACHYYKVPYLVAPHGMLEPWALSYKAGKKQTYYRLIEKPALNRAAVLQMTATTEAENIVSLGLKPPVVMVPNGIHRQDFETLSDPELFYHQFPETRHKTLLLFLGRIDPKKGLDLLAPALAQVRQQFPDTHLVVAGPDNIGFLPTAKGYFAAAGCSEAVTFTGMLTGELKQAALAAADIYVAPSYSEGFSMSVLEGMASGLPCVITTGCNFPEAAAAGVAHVVKPDSQEIAAALTHCLDNPRQAQAMGRRARQFIFEQYTWDKIAAKLIKVYEAIINEEPLPTFSPIAARGV